MSAKKLLEERAFTIKNAITSEHEISRIPLLSNVWSWKYLDSGYKLSEALYDYGKMEKSIRHHVETYKMDLPYERGYRNPVQVSTALGDDQYIIDDELGSISIKDQCFMEEDDYDKLIADPIRYLWEDFIPRKHKAFHESGNAAKFGGFLGEFGKFVGFLGKMDSVLMEEYGFPAFNDPNCPIGVCDSGVELLMTCMRGIRGFSMDMRRKSSKVLEAIQVLDSVFVDGKAAHTPVQKGTCEFAAFDEHTTMISQTVMNTKQFEKFYLPHLKKVVNYVVNNDKISYIFMEGDNIRFFDFFKDLPKGYFAYCSESDDIYTVKKELPNMTVVGGLKTQTLAKGTPEECIDMAKKLINDIGYDRRYIMCEEKMISFPSDCKSENLKAVTEYVSDFRF